MKFAHLADLHIGKRLYEYSLVENQKDILNKIVELVKVNCVDGVVISGDIYDKSVPPVDAVKIMDDFLSALSSLEIFIIIIGGNHDSVARLSFASKILEKNNVYISPVFSGNVEKIEMTDNFGRINFYLLPYIRPVNVRRAYEDFEGETFTEALKFVMDKINPDTSIRNVLVSHQFVTGAQKSDSEEIYVGGSENVAYTLFDDFDYVALGHLHMPQAVGRETVRYAGTPLKYSFSEISHKKSMTIVDIREKGKVEIEVIPLIPAQDLVELKGSLKELINESVVASVECNSFVKITLTDEVLKNDALDVLKQFYPYIVSIGYDNSMTRQNNVVQSRAVSEEQRPEEIVEELFVQQNNRQMNDVERGLTEKLVKKVWEREYETD
ncbi:hypothetical protein HMPREF1635_06485 [Clostridiales bacterium S5-A14a]|nr:hypothetical protein HMPREF1635_06485 [Clostridiales bacterium S5-A14a]